MSKGLTELANEEDLKQIDFVEMIGIEVECPFLTTERDGYYSCGVNRFKPDFVPEGCVYALIMSAPPTYMNQCCMKSTPENLFLNIANKSYKKIKSVKEVKK